METSTHGGLSTRGRKPEPAALALPASLDRWTGTLLSRMTRRVRDSFEERLRPLGIRSRHYVVLAVIEESPRTQVEIGRLLGVDRTTMVTLIDDLERVGYVARAPQPGDRRAYAVTLTETGRSALEQGTEAARLTEAECFAPLDADEQTRLRDMLIRLLG